MISFRSSMDTRDRNRPGFRPRKTAWSVYNQSAMSHGQQYWMVASKTPSVWR